MLNFTKDHWQPYLSESFNVSLATNQSLTLQLIEVSSLGAKSNTRREPYALLFRGPTQPVFAQSTVELEHSSLGRLALFLVPIGPDDQGMRYEAIFT